MDIELDLPEDFHSPDEDNEDQSEESELPPQLTPKIEDIEPPNPARDDVRARKTESVKRP
jgi:hypothetical protein